MTQTSLRVFVTGATGYIGSAVVRELIGAGHQVTGMTRWADRTLFLRELGAQATVGDLRDPESYRDMAASHDVLLHLAQEDSSARESVDRSAIRTLIEDATLLLRHDDEVRRAIIYTSGCFVLGETGEPADEYASTLGAPEYVAWRPDHERIVLGASSENLATAVIRPGMVYGGRGGVISGFFASAERQGAAEFVGDGTNRWSPVYLGDVARLYRMVAERRARGIFHCTEPRAVRVGDLAVAASRVTSAGGRTRHIKLEDARKDLGGFADALVMDQVVISPRAEALGWTHTHPPFVDSADRVFAEWKEESGEPTSGSS